MDLGRLIAQLSKDWEWVSFLVQYCAGRNWMHRRMLAKVADAETMKKHVWSGYDSPNAVPSSEQRARKAGDSEKSK